MRKITLFFVSLMVLTVFFSGVPKGESESGFYGSLCQGCHGSTQTCAGCHAHGVHSNSAHANLNLTGVTDETSYTVGETVTVTVSGGYRPGWVRAVLYDENMIELARSSGPGGMGGGASLPVQLTASAPLIPGTYEWNVSWYGNQNDESGAFFGPRWRLDPTNPNHGEEIVTTNSFDVTIQTAPDINLDPTSVDFGSVDLGQSATAYVDIGNIGTSALSVTDISLCAGTSYEFTWAPDAPFAVQPGGNQALEVTYTPVDDTTDTGCLAITSNDPVDGVVSLAVTGAAGIGIFADGFESGDTTVWSATVP